MKFDCVPILLAYYLLRAENTNFINVNDKKKIKLKTDQRIYSTALSLQFLNIPLFGVSRNATGYAMS